MVGHFNFKMSNHKYFLCLKNTFNEVLCNREGRLVTAAAVVIYRLRYRLPTVPSHDITLAAVAAGSAGYRTVRAVRRTTAGTRLYKSKLPSAWNTQCVSY